MALLAALNIFGKMRDLVCSPRGQLHIKSFSAAPKLLGSTQRTVDNTSTALTDIPPDAFCAYIQVKTADIYWNTNANVATPSATVGQEAGIGDDLYIYGRANLVNFRAVRQGATSATLKIQWYAEDEDWGR